eukprot:NODE_6_length_70510_cov_1.054395.p30 type:complete len:291 gc:universal NODE_6_length_70510_cov_1.054395:19887-19015(-)
MGDLALSAFLAGLLSRMVIAPLDVIKIRNQVSTLPSSLQISKIFQEEGLFAFWKGNLSAEMLYGSYTLVQMTSYKHIKSNIPIENNFARHFISGALSGVAATFVTFPFDVLRTRFALQVIPIYKSVPHAISTIVKEEHFGLYKGLGPSLVAIMPYMGITFATYEFYKNFIQSINIISPTKLDLVSGALAGFSGKLSTYPLDTLRKRMQIQGPRVSEFLHNVKTPNYRNLRRPDSTKTTGFAPGYAYRVFRHILNEEGVSALFKGVRPALLKSVIGSSLTFTLTNYFNANF